MVKVNFASKDYLDIISEFEIKEFGYEAYSYEAIEEMLKDNYLLKDNDNIIILQDESELIGYIIFHISNDFTDIYKIYIREHDRNKGNGMSLLSEVEKLSKRFKSKKLMIEVRESNTNAISLYKKFSFNQISIRNNYYKSPNENALIFEKIIEV